MIGLGVICVPICICSGLMCSPNSETSNPPVLQFDLKHDKAEEMRDRGFTGSDQDLANTYDRAKDIDDAKRFRRERLGDN